LRLVRAEPRLDVERLAGAHIHSAEHAVLAFAVDGACVIGIDLAVIAVEAEDVDPFGARDAGAVAGGAGTAPGAVVLKAAVDLVRFAHVDADRVELADGQVLEMLPGLALVVAV